MKQSLELRQRQKQAFNARFNASVRILQMPNAELKDEVREILDSNPLLEEIDDGAPERSLDNDWSLDAGRTTQTDSKDIIDYASVIGEQASIRDHLRSQIRSSGLDETRRIIANTIVECIDDNGYLTSSIEEIAELLSESMSISHQQIESVLQLVQQCDPPGVAARNLRECLLNQLEFADASKSVRSDARSILENQLELLADAAFEQIGIEIDCDPLAVSHAVELIRRLNPKPGNQFGGSADIVIPDVIARKIKNRWHVELNANILPKVRISNQYRLMIQPGQQTESNRYLTQNLNRANVFLDNLKRRHETILRVAKEIVRQQHAFLEDGEMSMQPLTMNEIADALELHESTVSRTCSHKYIMTPRGTYELKFFFSYRIWSDFGDDESALSVKHKLQEIVRHEDRIKPLSDQQITDRLRDHGIRIARRTVAKYRASLYIPSQTKRKAIAINQMEQ